MLFRYDRVLDKTVVIFKSPVRSYLLEMAKGIINWPFQAYLQDMRLLCPEYALGIMNEARCGVVAWNIEVGDVLLVFSEDAPVRVIPCHVRLNSLLSVPCHAKECIYRSVPRRVLLI